MFLSLRSGFILGTGSMYIRNCAFKVELLYCCKHVALSIVYMWQYNILLNINIFLILITDYFLSCFVILAYAQ